MVIIVYSMITIPMQLAFDRFPDLGGANYTVDGIFFFDILLSFNTAYFSEEEEAYVAVRSKIIVNFLKTSFFIDLISCIPFDTIVESLTTGSQNNVKILQLLKIIRLVRLLKVAKVFNIVKIIYFIEDDLHVSPIFISLGATCLQVKKSMLRFQIKILF